MHSRPDAAYGLFTFTRRRVKVSRRHTRTIWQAFVRPEYYGMLMFEQAFPPGAQLLTTNSPAFSTTWPPRTPW